MAEQIAIGGNWREIINAFMTKNEITDTGWQTGGITLESCKVANDNANSVPKYRLAKLGSVKILYIQASLAIMGADAAVTFPTTVSVGTAGVFTSFVGTHGIEWVLFGNALSLNGNTLQLDLTKGEFTSFYQSFIV